MNEQAPSGGSRLGPLVVSDAFAPLLGERVRSLEFPPLPGMDCDDCRMVRAGAFAPLARCCNTIPDLPNFLAGAILEHGQSGGSPERVASWVDAGRGDPLFLYAPPGLKERCRRAVDGGLAGALPCPLLDARGRCTIYAHRPYLCTGYHCTYPDVLTMVFYNCLTSLLALHSAIAAQFLIGFLGIDTGRFSEAWERAGAAGGAWTEGGALRDEFRREVWQGREDPAAFYRACYRTIVERRATIRSEVAGYRREQLLRRLRAAPRPDPERERAIREQPGEPVPLEPPAALERALQRDFVVFADHRWTVPEHEGFLLRFHARLASR